MQIYPGSPWENGYNERFNGTLRKEVLNAEWFHTTPHHTTSLGRYQCLAQAIQPDQTSSRIKHAPTRPRNPIRETKN
jgi:transposase InsO family protein